MPASTPMARSLASRAASRVRGPITGTSKRKSWLGLETFTIMASLSAASLSVGSASLGWNISKALWDQRQREADATRKRHEELAVEWANTYFCFTFKTRIRTTHVIQPNTTIPNENNEYEIENNLPILNDPPKIFFWCRYCYILFDKPGKCIKCENMLFDESGEKLESDQEN